MERISRVVRDEREKLLLVAYFVLILGLAWPIVEMLSDAWEVALADDGVSNAIVRLIRFVVLDAIFDASHQTVTASVFGLYAGLLVLMTVDQKKRWQAFLLWLGTIVAVGALSTLGWFLPQFDIVEHGPALVLGFVVGFLVGGGWRIADLFEDDSVVEFRRAAQTMFVLLTAFVVVGLVELHVEYPGLDVPADEPLNLEVVENDFGLVLDGLAFNLVIVALFLFILRRFVRYDADRMFFILGPRAAGKSLFLIGSYLEALGRVQSAERSVPLEPSHDLMDIVEGLDQTETDWIVEATPAGEVKRLSFQYVHGSVFPMNIRVSALDYAGEYLRLLPDALTGTLDDSEMDQTLVELVDGVASADALILTIDIDRFESNEPLEISEYFTILNAVESKDILLVATKADLLVDEFKQERGHEPHLHFDEFTEFVNDHLRSSENIDALVQEANVDIHPVYYQTKLNESGERVPKRDQTGSVMTVGFDEFLDRIGRM